MNLKYPCHPSRCQSIKAKKEYEIWFKLNKYRPADMQELGEILQHLGICQYHYSMHILNKVDILLAPYNYVISEGVQSSIKLSIKNKILIFDEGHNIENVLEDSSSLKLNKKTLDQVINDLSNPDHFNLRYNLMQMRKLL